MKHLEDDKLDLLTKAYAGQESLEIIWRKKISTSEEVVKASWESSVLKHPIACVVGDARTVS